MGNQIIKQPDGKYAVFSSVTGTINLWDATGDEVMQYFVDRAVADTQRSVEKILTHVANDQPRKAYYQFAMTWEEALQSDRERGGEAHLDFGPCPEES